MNNKSRMFEGTSLLQGDNTIPGLRLPPELEALLPRIFKEVNDFGCDFFPTVVQMLTYDEISEVAAYSGFPVRYPHWKWGMEYEELQRGYEHGMHRIYEMVINCLCLNVPVLTIEGTKPAGKVVVGDKVITANGERTVVAVERQKPSKTIKIEFYGCAEDIICSPNHKWKILGKNGYEWKESNQIKESDYVLVGDSWETYRNKPAMIHWDNEKVVESTASNVRNRLKTIPSIKQMTIDLAELIGIVVGDGSAGVKTKENAISICISKKELSYIDYVKKLVTRVFNLEPLVETHRKSVDVITLCSKEAVWFFDKIGIKKGCTYNVPWSIFSSSCEYRAAFIRGLFDTDGSASGVLSFSNYNKELVAGVQLLLLEMGIVSKYYEVENGKNKIHVIRIRGTQNVEKFCERVGFSNLRKKEILNQLVKRNPSTNRGCDLPFVRNLLIECAKSHGWNTYNQPSLGRSIERMKTQSVGTNAMIGFVKRAKKLGYDYFDDILNDYLSQSFVCVKSIKQHKELETVDIALDKGHDFIARGLVTHNTNPCYIYCLDSNTLVDNITVVAHALGHNDFFKNNIFFAPTRVGDQNMMNRLANHGTRIRRYMKRWGKERVTEFIDYVLRIETLIDPAKAWKPKKIKNLVTSDYREYEYPNRLKVKDGHEYMEDYINPEDWIKKQNEKIRRKEIAKEIGIFKNPTKDIMGFLRDHAPLKPWQADIISMLYEESLYFAPQRMTKMMNEGWASYIDHNIMCKRGLCGLGGMDDSGVFEYAKHKMGVLGGKYSINPYKLGYCLFNEIELRWDKGRFGSEYENCKDIQKKEKWDTKAGLGHKKVFEVRATHNDLTALLEFFTEEFCNKYEFFQWRLFPNGEYKIVDRDYKSIKKKLIDVHINGGLPVIHLTEPNYKGKGYLFLQHQWTGKTLYQPYVAATLQALYFLWGNKVYLATKDQNEDEIVWCAHGPNGDNEIQIITREDCEKNGEEEGFEKI